MCFGIQEYYLACHCPGRFRRTCRCRRQNCEIQVEHRIELIPGDCPACVVKRVTCRPLEDEYLPSSSRGNRGQGSQKSISNRGPPVLRTYHQKHCPDDFCSRRPRENHTGSNNIIIISPESELGTSRWTSFSQLHSFYDHILARANLEIERVVGKYEDCDYREVEQWEGLQEAIKRQRKVYSLYFKERDAFWEERDRIDAARIEEEGEEEERRKGRRPSELVNVPRNG